MIDFNHVIILNEPPSPLTQALQRKPNRLARDASQWPYI